MEETIFSLASASKVLSLRLETSSGAAPGLTSLASHCEAVLASCVPHSSSQGGLFHRTLLFHVLGTASSFGQSGGWRSQDNTNTAVLHHPTAREHLCNLSPPRMIPSCQVPCFLLGSWLWSWRGLVTCLYTLDAPGAGNSAQLAKDSDRKDMSEEGH